MGRCLVFHHIYEYKEGTICMMMMIASVYLIYPCLQVFRMGYFRKYQLEVEIVLQSSFHSRLQIELTVPLSRWGLGMRKRWLNSWTWQKVSLIQPCFLSRTHPLVEICMKLFNYMQFLQTLSDFNKGNKLRNRYRCYICLLTELVDCWSNDRGTMIVWGSSHGASLPWIM